MKKYKGGKGLMTRDRQRYKREEIDIGPSDGGKVY